MVTVEVAVGVGAWVATTRVRLVACPHVGDSILVGDHVITCDRVYIGRDSVQVSETRRFASEDEAKNFFT